MILNMSQCKSTNQVYQDKESEFCSSCESYYEPCEFPNHVIEDNNVYKDYILEVHRHVDGCSYNGYENYNIDYDEIVYFPILKTKMHSLNNK
jgi:hypothetical protein